MDEFYDEFEALGRIISRIKAYRQTARNAQADGHESIDDYLNQQLTREDWLLWKRLHKNAPGDSGTNEDTLSAQATTGSQFRLLLSQYKRACFERYAGLMQSLNTSRID